MFCPVIGGGGGEKWSNFGYNLDIEWIKYVNEMHVEWEEK